LEFLIIVPMMFLMISLILYAGWWSYGKLSAQNAAYSHASWAPRVQLSLGSGRVGNTEASMADLREPIGMKSMWSDDIPNMYSGDLHGYSRLGGTGLTVAVSPAELGWGEWTQVWEVIGAAEGGADLPRGTAFFLYSPFMSGYQGGGR
jgi:hypothetical protein